MAADDFEVRVFALADHALERVLQQVTPDQWDRAVPDYVAARESGLTLRKIVSYHCYDEAWVPDVLAGKTADEVGDTYDHYKHGTGLADPAAEYSVLMEAAIAAAEDCAQLDDSVHLSYGDFPGREYLKHISSFRGFRAYDIARFIGVDRTLPPDLVAGLHAEVEPQIDTWRAWGVFGPAVPVPADADPQSRLLGMVGRDPNA